MSRVRVVSGEAYRLRSSAGEGKGRKENCAKEYEAAGCCFPEDKNTTTLHREGRSSATQSARDQAAELRTDPVF